MSLKTKVKHFFARFFLLLQGFLILGQKLALRQNHYDSGLLAKIRILMMSNAALRALGSQLIGLFLIFLLGRNQVLSALSPFELACAQGVLAASASQLLRSSRWWSVIHLVFMPTVALAATARLPTWLYGTGFVVLVGLYWTTFRTQVPLFLSNRVTVHRLAQWLPDARPLKVLDLGSGTGEFVVDMALLRPNWSIRGIESAPLPYLLSRFRIRQTPNASVLRGDFWRHSMNEYDLVYAFLSPVPMPEVWRKARREMNPGAWLISNSFPIPGLEPNARIKIDDARETSLFCYRIPERSRAAPATARNERTTS